MKVLLLVQKDQRAILDRLYDGVAANCECDTRWLSSDEQANLRRYFKQHVQTDQYQRIILFLRFKKELKQVAFIKRIPNLVILEHDAYQNYIPCKYTGKFSKHYRHLPWARVISSGAVVTRRLQAEGVDAVFVPKGYDQALLSNLQQPRDIELGFIGSTKSVAYSQRKELLEQLAKTENLLVTRTNSGQDYLNTLNRIRFFVSADIGMGEYMIKNFEAMACGCVLLAYDHGTEESQALGLLDMQNVVLYRNLEELQQKLQLLRTNTVLADQIAAAGQQLAEQQFSFDNIGKKIVQALQPPLRPQPAPSMWSRLCSVLGY